MAELRSCNDCGAQPGTSHEDGCDIARCMETGLQRIQHDCGPHCDTCLCQSCDDDIWTGEWPGVAECREYGWYSFFGPDYGQTGWIRCAPDHPAATEDLNRLQTECTWNPDRKRWQR